MQMSPRGQRHRSVSLGEGMDIEGGLTLLAVVQDRGWFGPN